MAKDLYEDDLLRKPTPAQKPQDAAAADLRVRALSDASLTRMVRQKEELKSHVADAVKEIESLRMRQGELEKEKVRIEVLTRKQEEYERGKRETIDNLIRSVTLLEKEESQATRLVELLMMTRNRFRESLAELQAIDESRWNAGDFEMELDKAMVLLDDAKGVYKKGLARVEAAGGSRNLIEKSVAATAGDGSTGGVSGFKGWFKAGLAFWMPMLIFMIIMSVLYYVIRMVR